VTVLQVAALALVAATGTATVLVREPLRQLVVAGFFGLALGILFFVFGAPDVALSEIVVAAVAVPAMALLTLARMADRGTGGEPADERSEPG
jgi:energy-converting hydrogenase B subunit D